MGQNLFFFLTNKKQTSFLYDLYDNLSLRDGMWLMREHGYTCVPVVSPDGEYKGAVTEGDFLYYLTDHPDTDLDNVFIRQILRPDFIQAVPFNVSMGQLLATSLEQNFVPVVDDRNIFIGIVTRKNILAYLMHDKDVKDRTSK
ncbi:CBS domain-containing protein [Faecalibaculum rodentium]|uniref:CBS domain-containing protein n=1 Tax=Faecalibaculum rodentium TaxID=1702221 RepID=UPI00259B8E5C|nr:CBS domain-containing protein [Faecalibaculum rodentium]